MQKIPTTGLNFLQEFFILPLGDFMKKYFLSRVLQLVPILLGVTFLTFAMMQFAAEDAVDVLYSQ